MTNFTYKNHLKYKIGGEVFAHRSDSYQKYEIEVGKADMVYFKKSTASSEVLRIADLVFTELGKECVIFFSGGTDSEIVLRAFLKIGVKPKCIMIRLKNGHNLHDVQTATIICKELGVDLSFIDFDIHEFVYSGEAAEFSEQIQCSQITFSMIFNCIKKLNLPVVMGGSIPLVKTIRNGKTIWYYSFRENEEGCAMRFVNLYNIPVINEWFAYTPESMLHFLTNPVIKEVAENKIAHKLSIESSKNKTLVEYLPNIRLRPKTHGFEKLLPLNLECYRNLTANQCMRLTSCLDGIEYTEVIRLLKGEP
jgi:hypothetical protein